MPAGVAALKLNYVVHCVRKDGALLLVDIELGVFAGNAVHCTLEFDPEVTSQRGRALVSFPARCAKQLRTSRCPDGRTLYRITSSYWGRSQLPPSGAWISRPGLTCVRCVLPGMELFAPVVKICLQMTQLEPLGTTLICGWKSRASGRAVTQLT